MKPKILHLDIETAPSNVYTWSLWPKAINPNDVIKPGYTLCWAAMWDNESKVQYAGLNTHTHTQMIKYMWDLLDEADIVVHYNGTKFDIPVLNKEFALLGLAPPSTYTQVDLFRTVKANFRFESNKLDFVAQQFGLGKKTAHKGMALWHGCMANNPADWKVMERYNRQDVKLLKKLYKYLLGWIPQHPNMGLYGDGLRPTCTNCGSHKVVKKGTQINTQAASYDRYKCSACGTNMRSRFRTKTSGAGVLARTK